MCLQNRPHRERLKVIIYLARQKQEYGIDFNIQLKHLKPHNFHKVKQKSGEDNHTVKDCHKLRL